MEKLKDIMNNENQDIKEGDFGLGKNINAESFDKLEKDVQKLKDDFQNEKENIVSLKKELENSRFDLMTMLGIFVGLITYLGLEIQVFKTVNNPLMIIGISMFFISSILLFILGINTLIKKYETFSWDDFKNPIYLILIFLFLLSIIFIILGYKDYSKSNSFEYKIDKIYKLN